MKFKSSIPGHDKQLPQRTRACKVLTVGEKAQACRYCANSSFDLALVLCPIGGAVEQGNCSIMGVIADRIGTSHNQSLKFCFPFKMTFLFFKSCNCCFENIAIYLSSHN